MKVFFKAFYVVSFRSISRGQFNIVYYNFKGSRIRQVEAGVTAPPVCLSYV